MNKGITRDQFKPEVGTCTTKADKSSNATAMTRSVFRLDVTREFTEKFQPIYEALGFSFESVGEQGHCKVVIPYGWKTKVGTFGIGRDIIDERGRIRAFYLQLDGGGFMILHRRYSICYEYTRRRSFLKGKFVKVFVQDNANGRILYIAGCAQENSKECEDLKEKAKVRLNAKHPGWENPLNCWD